MESLFRIYEKRDKQNNLDAELEKVIENVNNGIKKLYNGRYEVDVVKEKLPLWYYSLMVTFIIVLLIVNFLGFLSGVAWIGIQPILLGLIASGISFDLNLIGVILCFCNRKYFRKAKVFFIFGLFFKIVAILNLWEKWYFWYYVPLTVILDFILVILFPKWKIDIDKKIVDEQDLTDIINNNNKIYDTFR